MARTGNWRRGKHLKENNVLLDCRTLGSKEEEPLVTCKSYVDFPMLGQHNKRESSHFPLQSEGIATCTFAFFPFSIS